MNPLKPIVPILIISITPIVLILGLGSILAGLDLSDLVITFICLMVIAISFAIIFTTLNIFKVHARHAERLKMIETGREIAPDPDKGNDILLIVGAIVFSVGVGFVGAIFIGGYNVWLLGSAIAVLLSGFSMIILFTLFSLRNRNKK